MYKNYARTDARGRRVFKGKDDAASRSTKHGTDCGSTLAPRRTDVTYFRADNNRSEL
jgi:hypothetical protein